MMSEHTSNFTPSKVQVIFIEIYQLSAIPMFYTAAITTQRPKSAADWSAVKDCNLSKQTQQTQHHSIDRNRTFLHVKFQIWLTILFTKKFTFKKNDIFQGDCVLFLNVGV
jgi:hypothetical protein